MDTEVPYLLQWLIALGLVGIVEFVDFANGWTPHQKRGDALVAGGWAAGALPAVKLIVSVVYLGGVWIQRRHSVAG